MDSICGSTKERNPYTGRCVNVCKSNTHERIANDSKRQFGCYKKCRPHQYRHTHTKRCRNTNVIPMKTNTRSKSSSSKSRKTRSPFITMDRVYYRPRSTSKSTSRSRSRSKSRSKSLDSSFSIGKLYDLREDIWEEHPEK